MRINLFQGSNLSFYLSDVVARPTIKSASISETPVHFWTLGTALIKISLKEQKTADFHNGSGKTNGIITRLLHSFWDYLQRRVFTPFV